MATAEEEADFESLDVGEADGDLGEEGDGVDEVRFGKFGSCFCTTAQADGLLTWSAGAGGDEEQGQGDGGRG